MKRGDIVMLRPECRQASKARAHGKLVIVDIGRTMAVVSPYSRAVKPCEVWIRRLGWLPVSSQRYGVRTEWLEVLEERHA